MSIQHRIDKIKKDLNIESEADITAMKVSNTNEVLISLRNKNGWVKVAQATSNEDAQALFIGLMTGSSPEPADLQQPQRDGSHNHVADASVNSVDGVPDSYKPDEQSEGVLIGAPGDE